MISPKISEENLKSNKSIEEALEDGFVACTPGGRQYYIKHVSADVAKSVKEKENRPPARQSMQAVSDVPKMNSKGPSQSEIAGDCDRVDSLEFGKKMIT